MQVVCLKDFASRTEEFPYIEVITEMRQTRDDRTGDPAEKDSQQETTGTLQKPQNHRTVPLIINYFSDHTVCAAGNIVFFFFFFLFLLISYTCSFQGFFLL